MQERGRTFVKRLVLIAVATVAFAATPLLAATAMPRAAAHPPATASASAAGLARDSHGLAWAHMVRMARDRDETWSRSLRRFRDSFD